MFSKQSCESNGCKIDLIDPTFISGVAVRHCAPQVMPVSSDLVFVTEYTFKDLFGKLFVITAPVF